MHVVNTISGICLHNGKCVSIDLRSAGHYFKLSADQRTVNAHYHSAMRLLQGLGLSRDLSRAIREFKVSADLHSPNV
jgi:TPR repeat protein